MVELRKEQRYLAKAQSNSHICLQWAQDRHEEQYSCLMRTALSFTSECSSDDLLPSCEDKQFETKTVGSNMEEFMSECDQRTLASKSSRTGRKYDF